jgi:mutator protein MutT
MNIDKVIVLSSAVISNTAGQLLLLQRSNSASFASHWQLVEGKMEEGESPTDALKREIKEEIGATVKTSETKLISHTQLEVRGMKYLAIRVVFAVEIETCEIILSNEHVAFNWYLPSEALGLPLLPRIKDVLEKLI